MPSEYLEVNFSLWCLVAFTHLTLPLRQVLRAWAKVRHFCLRLHHIGETYLMGYFSQLLLNQGHKLLSYFFV